MTFNPTDYTKAPWADGVMTLNHEECTHVINACNGIKIEHPERAEDDFFIYGEYNLIDWKKSINGDTYRALKPYDLEINTQGINAEGIIPEPEVEPEPEIPTEPEVPVEETPVEPEPEVVEEPTEEEVTEETPAE